MMLQSTQMTTKLTVRSLLVAALATALTFAAGPTSAASITLGWNPNTESDLAGYRLFMYGSSLLNTTTAQAMANSSVVKTDIPGVGTAFTVNNLAAATAYFFRLAAYDSSGNQSAFNRDASGNNVEISTITPAALPPVGAVGSVVNLAAAPAGSNSATLSFTEINDGTGQPAQYDIRFQSPTIDWGTAASVTLGTCSTPLAGTQIGATKTCTILGLQASTDYQFQLVAFRGTMNVNAVFGSLSNIAGARTSAAVDGMPPNKPRNLRLQ